jgi:hypothetical protein
MVGDRIIAGEAEQQTAIGEAPNRAARLQSLARPGGITIDAATRRHVGSLFDITALGARTLKGIPEPVEAFEVRAEHAGGLSRFEAPHQAVTPLTGRKDELDILRSHWEEVKTSKSRTMLVSGEAGIGKSHLLLAFEDLLLPEQVTTVRYFCSPHHRDTPLYPVISQIERASNIVRDESDEAKLNNLTAYLSSNHASEQDVAQITDLVLLRSSPGLPTLNFSLRLQMQRIFAVLVRTLEQIARVRPLLVVLYNTTSVRSIDLLFQWLTRHCLLEFVLWFEIPCCSLGFLKYRARKEALRCVARGCRSDYLSAIVGPIRPENRPIRQNQVQIDTTQNFSRILIEWALLGSSFAIDRTLVI